MQVSVLKVKYYKLKHTMLLLSLAAGFVFTTAITSSAASPHIPTETITGRITAQNGYAWNYGYDIGFKNSALHVRVSVNLIPAGGVTKPELDSIKHIWEKGIEQIWSNKFSLIMPSGQHYPIVVDVDFKGPRFHHEVIIRPGKGYADELNWNLMDSPELVAHEFGHMLGLFDEYEKGGISPQDAIIDTTGIMTSRPKKNHTYARYYNGFRRWFIDKTKLSDASLLPNNVTGTIIDYDSLVRVQTDE